MIAALLLSPKQEMCHTDGMTLAIKKPAKKKPATKSMAHISANAKRRRAAVKISSNNLLVAKPRTGKDALSVLKAAGIFTAKGKLNPDFA